MRPTDSDPFDLGFDAADEFTTGASDPWRASAPPSLSPVGGFDDPFAEFPPARPREEAPRAPQPRAPQPLASQAAAPAIRPTPQAQAQAAQRRAPQPVAAAPVDDDRDLDIPAEAPVAAAPTYHEPIADDGLGDAAIPRITIHAFYARPETAALVEKAAADRRMARASTIVREGGLEAAVEYYQNQPTPSLVMVETTDGAQRLLHLLDSLAQVCDPGTKVVVVGQTNDIALYRELIRRGVSEYLTQPLGPLQVIRAVGALYADPSAPFVGRQIAFVGAKGGVGASTLAHNFAWSMAEKMQTATVLADLDLAFGTAGLDFNQDPLQGMLDALTQPDRLDPVLMDRMMVRCGDRLSLFAAPASLDDDYEIDADAYEEVTQKIRGAAPFVVLDIPHVWNAAIRRVLVGSDDLVVVATPDLASLRNAKNIIDLVKGSRPNDVPPRLVLNQVGVPGRPEIPVKDFGEALGVQPSLVLPFDPKPYGQAANNGQMLAEVAPKSKAAEGLEHLARLISRREPPAVQKSSMLSGLFKKK
ncbi:CpaE family protein [Caulobacter sp. 1776]|uniref:CpaE family protein n=1 Tax=Caulobacter sp. 1776 TaxID=3156420 RepID=UPI003399231F